MSFTIECEFCYYPIVVTETKFVWANKKCEKCGLQNVIRNPNPNPKRLDIPEDIDPIYVIDPKYVKYP